LREAIVAVAIRGDRTRGVARRSHAHAAGRTQHPVRFGERAVDASNEASPNGRAVASPSQIAIKSACFAPPRTAI
jgi:hypothetical protein